MDGSRDGEGSGEETKEVAVEEGGRCSLRRTCVDIDVNKTGGKLSSSLHASNIVSSVVLASVRIFRILWIN